MKIKVVYKTLDDGSYVASSVVFPTCAGCDRNKNDALVKLDKAIMDYVENEEKKISRTADSHAHDLG